jgi:transposase
LSDARIEEIASALRKEPAQFGLGGQWDGKTLSRFIEQQWGISLGVRQCQRLFRHFGFRLRKPRPKIAHANGEAQAEYKKTAPPLEK